tara:strand:- start:41 stop:172 length:132 start_codon:yes stop_codon:yes gene_type:complete
MKLIKKDKIEIFENIAVWRSVGLLLPKAGCSCRRRVDGRGEEV